MRIAILFLVLLISALAESNNSLQNNVVEFDEDPDNIRTALFTIDDYKKSASLLDGQQNGIDLSPINANVVQCQFVNNGAVYCFHNCSAALYDYKFGSSLIKMRKCAGNQHPVVHVWEESDGLLLSNLGVDEDQTNGTVIAACTFSIKNTLFNCQRSYMKKDANENNAVCATPIEWSGNVEAGDPLTKDQILRGVIIPEKSDNDGRKQKCQMLQPPKQKTDWNLSTSSNSSDNSTMAPPVSTTDESPIAYDERVIQCIYFADHTIECQNDCDFDAVARNISETESYMVHICNGPTVNHTWKDTDGILDEFIIQNNVDRSNRNKRIIAICVTQLIDFYFECMGVTTCNMSRPNDEDSCYGGRPWRGDISSHDELKEGAPLMGNITAHALNSGDGSPVVANLQTNASGHNFVEKICTYTPSTGGALYCALAMKRKDNAGSDMPSLQSAQNLSLSVLRDEAQKLDRFIRTTCLIMADDFYCKSYRRQSCSVDDNGTANCYLTRLWPSNNLTKSCVMLRKDDDQFVSETCYINRGANVKSPKEIKWISEGTRVKALLELYQLGSVQRLECDYFGAKTFCVGYSSDKCDFKQFQDNDRNYLDCNPKFACGPGDKVCEDLARVETEFRSQ